MKVRREIFKFYYVTLIVVSKKLIILLCLKDHVLLRMLAYFVIYFLPSYLSIFPGGIRNIFVDVNGLDINNYSPLGSNAV
jgi:hypothetical protein